jgi:hypothetical protein
MKTGAQWIEPQVLRGVSIWPKCEATIVTLDAMAHRQRLHKPLKCGLSAKIKIDGSLLCIRHAKDRALSVALKHEARP